MLFINLKHNKTVSIGNVLLLTMMNHYYALCITNGKRLLNANEVIVSPHSIQRDVRCLPSFFIGQEGVVEGFLFNKEGVYNFTIGMTLSKNARVGCSTMSRSSLVKSNMSL